MKDISKYSSVKWGEIKVVIFDVDGTLYHQTKLRKKMMLALFKYYLFKPWRLHEISILQHFRKARKNNTTFQGVGLEVAQYKWCAETINYPLAKIRQVIDYWIFTTPNQYLADCRYPGLLEFFATLKQHDIKVAIYSDYVAAKKMKAMNLEADLIVASTDPEIDRLKPNPHGLKHIARFFDVSSKSCLFIGDRKDLDGLCAIRAEMPYLILDKKKYDLSNFYFSLNNEFLAYPI